MTKREANEDAAGRQPARSRESTSMGSFESRTLPHYVLLGRTLHLLFLHESAVVAKHVTRCVVSPEGPRNAGNLAPAGRGSLFEKR
jgi:hypothetical protein